MGQRHTGCAPSSFTVRAAMLQAPRHAAGEFHAGPRTDNAGYSTHAPQFNSLLGNYMGRGRAYARYR